AVQLSYFLEGLFSCGKARSNLWTAEGARLWSSAQCAFNHVIDRERVRTREQLVYRIENRVPPLHGGDLGRDSRDVPCIAASGRIFCLPIERLWRELLSWLLPRSDLRRL